MDTRRARAPLALTSNPIVLALGQVVISAVLDIERYIPALQEVLRRRGYPRFERIDLQTIRLDPQSSLAFNQETKWVFSDRERSRSISIAPTFIVFEETRYLSFDDFVTEVQQIVALVNETIDVAFLDRVGFRRVNLLEPGGGLTVRDLIAPGIRGIDAHEFGSNDERRYEHWVNTSVGRLMVRVLWPASQVLPVELTATTLRIRKPADTEIPVAMVDIDHFADVSGNFGGELVSDLFWQLHDASDLAFRVSVTDDALKHWSS